MGPVNSARLLVKCSEMQAWRTGAFLLLIGGACASGIAISLYPVLKKSSPVPGSWSGWFQGITEGVLRFVSMCILLSIITLSQLFVKPG